MRMLQIVPRIYKGETIYSIAARIVLNDVSTSFSQSMINKFGNKDIQLNSIFPSYLCQLSSLTSCEIDCFIDNHSLFQYYSSFSPDRVKKQARDFLIVGDSSAAFKVLGLLSNRIMNEGTHKFCPVCASEQELAFGEAYWLLEHQLPLSMVCLKHECMLVSKPKARKQLVFSEIGSSVTDCTNPLLLKVAEINHFVLNDYSFDRAKLGQTYAVRLINKGLATTKSVRHIQWRNEMKAYFAPLMHDERVRKLLNSSVEQGFPANIFYNDDSSHHPIKHVLIISFLFEHFGDFIVAYGKGESIKVCAVKQPKPQVNIDEERHKKTLTLLKSGMPLRDIICKANVSAATVRNLARMHAIALKEHTRKVSSTMHRSILIQLVVGKPTEVIARDFNLSVGDIEQVLVGQTAIKILRQRIRFYTRRKTARHAVISALYTFGRPSISKLRKAVDKEYMWLYKHDRGWLNDFKNTYFNNK